MPVPRPLAALVLALAIAGPALAQSPDQMRATLARAHSPGGALSPYLMPPADAEHRGLGLHLDWGLATRPPIEFEGDQGIPGTSEHFFALGADVPLLTERVRLGARGGAILGTCHRSRLQVLPCRTGWLGGASLRSSLYHHTFAQAANTPRLAVGLATDLGESHHAVRGGAFAAGVPIAVSFQVRNETFLHETDRRFQPRTTLFLEPGVVTAWLRDGGSSGRSTFGEIGAGVAVLGIGSGAGVTLSVRKSLIRGSGWQFSSGLSWHVS